MSSTRLQCVFMLCASFAVAIDQPKPQKPECLSWDANGDWCSQSMDEPVVALQLSSQVRKRGSKHDHLASKAESRRTIVEEVYNYEPKETQEKPEVSMPTRKHQEEQESVVEEGTSFLQMGEAVVEAETPVTDADIFQVGKTDVTREDVPVLQSLEVPESKAQKLIQEPVDDDEWEEPSAPAPHGVMFSTASSVMNAIDVATGDPRKWGVGTPFFIVVLTMLVVVSMLVRQPSRKFIFSFVRNNAVAAKAKEDDEAMSTTCRPIEFRDPMLPDASASFGIPVTPLSGSISERLSFDIVERNRGSMIRADLTRLPGRDEWAKVEISLRGESSSSKSLTCTRVDTDSEIESRNVQDAVDSWLSLLVYDKCHDNPEITGAEPSQEDSQSENENPDQIVKPRKYSKSSEGKTGKKMQKPRLEVRDGQGNDCGMIEPDALGRYVYHQGDVKMVIDACRDQHAVVVSKDSKKYAIATGLTWDGSPELAGQEHPDFLQVDTVNDADAPDLLSVLMCVVAPMAFKR